MFCFGSGNLLLDCTLTNGQESCYPEGSDTPAQCAPVSGTPVTAALSSLMNSGQVQFKIQSLQNTAFQEHRERCTELLRLV